MSELLAVLRRRWMIVLIATLIVPAVAVAMAGRGSSLTSSTATVLLVDGVPDEIARVLPTGVSKHSDRDFATRAALAVNEDVAVVAAQGIAIDAETLLGGLSAKADVADNVIEFSYADVDAELAANAVNAYADAYSQVAREIQEERLEVAAEAAYAIAEKAAKNITFVDLPEDYDARIVADATLGDGAHESMLNLGDRISLAIEVQEDPVVVASYAAVSDTSSNDSLARTAALALIGGLFLGVLLALLVEYMDKRRGSEVA